MNSAPVTVAVMSGLVSVALEGEIDARTGLGLIGEVAGGLCQKIDVPLIVHVRRS